MPILGWFVSGALFSFSSPQYKHNIFSLLYIASNISFVKNLSGRVGCRLSGTTPSSITFYNSRRYSQSPYCGIIIFHTVIPLFLIYVVVVVLHRLKSAGICMRSLCLFGSLTGLYIACRGIWLWARCIGTLCIGGEYLG
jgi:hypothetical protein